MYYIIIIYYTYKNIDIQSTLYEPYHKHWDQHYILRGTGLSQSDHFVTHNVELSPDTTGNICYR